MISEIWAHQGSSHVYIENTLAAFKQAIAEGVDGIEFDVQRTTDGELVVIHDEHLMRLTGDNRFIWELTWAELQELTLETEVVKAEKLDSFHAKVPKLDDVLELIKDSKVKANIELKNSVYFYPGMEAAIVACVNKWAMQDRVVYSSFNHLSMKKMVTLVGSEDCAILTLDIQDKPWNYARQVGVSAYHPMIASLQHLNLVEKCQQAGLKVRTWTADADVHIYAALLLGVDAVMTNKTVRALELRKQFQEDGGKKALEYVKASGLKIIE